ncbi:unnamed protein product, partial [Nesidiocoris tenuis]
MNYNEAYPPIPAFQPGPQLVSRSPQVPTLLFNPANQSCSSCQVPCPKNILAISIFEIFSANLFRRFNPCWSANCICRNSAERMPTANRRSASDTDATGARCTSNSAIDYDACTMYDTGFSLTTVNTSLAIHSTAATSVR